MNAKPDPLGKTHDNPASKAMPSFIDFEASSLGSNSYPIEVAWSLPDGTVESHLVSPEYVGDWTDWSHDAEEVHGINLAQMKAEGRSPAWVCRRMNAQLAGRTVYSDEPDFDTMWLRTLFSAARLGPPSFKLDGLDHLLLGMIGMETATPDERHARLRALKSEARKREPRRHRAGWDVRYLVGLWRLAAAVLNETVDGRTIELYNKVPRPSLEGEGE